MFTTGTRPVVPTDPVARIMMWPVATAPENHTMRQAAETLAADEVGVLAVIERGRLVGLVSERDLARHLADGANPDHLTVGEMMTTDPLSARTDDEVGFVARTMLDAGVRHVPLFDDDGIAGMVSVRDVLDVLVSALEGEDVVELTPGVRVVLRSRESGR